MESRAQKVRVAKVIADKIWRGIRRSEPAQYTSTQTHWVERLVELAQSGAGFYHRRSRQELREGEPTPGPGNGPVR